MHLRVLLINRAGQAAAAREEQGGQTGVSDMRGTRGLAPRWAPVRRSRALIMRRLSALSRARLSPPPRGLICSDTAFWEVTPFPQEMGAPGPLGLRGRRVYGRSGPRGRGSGGGGGAEQ